jgi:hypothetical protein
MKKLISMLLFLPLMASCAMLRKAELDAEVRRLCAIDGGIKVYETVRLPPDKFNQWGQINFYQPTQGENTLGAEYIFKEEQHYYRRGNPEMSRSHYQVIRRSDNKLLGELIHYGRGGGDMPGPWHDSSFSCPDPAEGALNTLLKSIFVK